MSRRYRKGYGGPAGFWCRHCGAYQSLREGARALRAAKQHVSECEGKGSHE